MGMTQPVDDALFADIASHYAERAQADLIERAENGERWDVVIESIDELLCAVPETPRKDKRKHDDTCYARHMDCLANQIMSLIRE